MSVQGWRGTFEIAVIRRRARLEVKRIFKEMTEVLMTSINGNIHP
jgi:hypothetical protein